MDDGASSATCCGARLRGRATTCAQDNDPPELCPALSLPDLFRSGTPEQQESVSALLDAVPPYFSQAVDLERPHDGRRSPSASG